MKRLFIIFTAALMTVMAAACNASDYSVSEETETTAIGADNPADNYEKKAENKVLIAYFSATGTTKAIAENAANILDADLYAITPQTPYSDEDLDYYTGGRADKEQNDPTARPAISGSVQNIEQYNTVLLGYPIWHGQAPRIISTFLESYDFSDKIILPFCTSHSSGIGLSSDELQSLAENATWLKGESFSDDTTKEDIVIWLENNGLHDASSLQ